MNLSHNGEETDLIERLFFFVKMVSAGTLFSLYKILFITKYRKNRIVFLFSFVQSNREVEHLQPLYIWSYVF